MIGLRPLALALAASMLAACASAPQTARLMSGPPAGIEPVAHVSGVPFYPQEDHYCGPASLAMAVSWTGTKMSQEEVAPLVFTAGKKGTLQSDMISAARRLGMLATPVRSLYQILAEIDDGAPVVVFQNLGLEFAPVWHYAVAIGYNLHAEQIILHSGRSEARAILLSTFERTWTRAGLWALAISPPDRLPSTAGPSDVLRAANGLERTGQSKAAAAAYSAAIEKWPGTVGLYFGLGNALSGTGDTNGAIRAYREATKADPKHAPSWNNLGLLLARAGQRDAGIKAIERAIELGGPLKDVYRESLEEAKAGR